MRALVISDIHGIKTNLEIIRNRYIDLKCDKLIVLGDIYWGNKDNKNYNPKYVQKFLQSFYKNLICIKGNCDFKINPEQEPFPIQKDNVINITDNIYISHGNLYNETNWLVENSILIFGHYHIPFLKKIGNNLYINPGSISLPRSNNLPSYLFIDDFNFVIFDINNTILASIKVNN